LRLQRTARNLIEDMMCVEGTVVIADACMVAADDLM